MIVRATALAVVVALAATAVAAALRSPSRPPLAARTAIADAYANPAVARALRGDFVTGARAVAEDPHTMLVTFYSGARTQAQALIVGDGRVRAVSSFVAQAVPYGDWIAYTPAAIALGALLLVLCGAVLPLRRARNLDLVAILALNAGIVLFAQRYVRWSLLAVLVPLCYLAARGLWIGLAGGEGAPASRALLECLLGSWPAGRRVRVLRMIAGALALIYLMVCASSPGPVDVAYAVMEGATRIVQGVLPYGHLPGDVFHGDTYPIFSYALYVPLAAVAPVRSVWSSVEDELVLCALSALAAAALVARAAARSAERPAAPPAAGRARDDEAGLRAAICLLSFPAFAIVASSASSDIVLAAILALALVIWRRPAACSSLLAAGALFKVIPGVLLALSLAPLRRRRLAAALAAIAAVCAAAAALLVALGGAGAPLAMLRAVSYQLSRGESQSLWTALAPAAVQPLGEGVVLGVIAAIALALRARPQIAADRRRIAALAMAVVIAVQLVSNYWAPLYLAWFAPLAVLALLSEPRRAVGHASPAAAVWAPPEAMPVHARRSEAKPSLSGGR